MALVFFVYGLSFFSLGLSIFLRYDARSTKKIAHALWYLAGFALLHGLKEWLDMWHMLQEPPGYLRAAGPWLLLASFLLLFEYGRQILLQSQRGEPHEAAAQWLLRRWLYVPMLLFSALIGVYSKQPELDVSIWSRLVPGFLGATLSAVGTYLYYRNCIEPVQLATEARWYGRSWILAAMAFASYGIVAGLITEPATWFPASSWNTDHAQNAIGFPVQIIRAACALALAVSFSHLLKVFQIEHEYKLRSEIERRTTAMDLYEETRGFLDAMIGATDQCIVTLDADGKVDFASDLALQKLLCQHDAIHGQSFYARFHHSHLDGSKRSEDVWRGYLASAPSTRHRVDHDCFWRDNRTWFAVSYVAVPIHRAAHRSGLLISFTDLSEIGQVNA